MQDDFSYSYQSLLELIVPSPQWPSAPDHHRMKDLIALLPWSEHAEMRIIVRRFASDVLDAKTFSLNELDPVLVVLFGIRHSFLVSDLSELRDHDPDARLPAEEVAGYIEYVMMEAWASSAFDWCMEQLGLYHVSLVDIEEQAKTEFRDYLKWKSERDYSDLR